MRQDKFNPGKLRIIGSRINRPSVLCLVFLLCLGAGLLSGQIFKANNKPADATTNLSLVGSASISISASSSAVSLPITPSPSGTLASSSHNLTATTSVPTGYSLSLGMAETPSLTPISGSYSAPVALTNNTWGYAIAGVGGFDSSYATPTPSATSKWANPRSSTAIKNTSNSTAGDTTTIYYGAKADTTIPSGTFTNTITYTATANTSSIPTPSIVSVSPSKGTTAGGGTLSIVGTGFTINDQSVTTAVTIDGQNCTDATISGNTPSAGQDTIYCTIPAHASVAAVNVAVATWGGTATKTSGYTYIAPTATISAPTASQIFNAGTTSTTLTVTTDIPAICYYGTATAPATQMTTTGGTTHSQSITSLANESTNTQYVRCQAQSGHSYGAEVIVAFYIKAAAPTLSSITPTTGTIQAAGTTSQTIGITTNVASTCYYGTGSTPTASMSTTGSTSHSQSISTSNATSYTYYVRCRAGSGNTISDYSSSSSTTFHIRTATPAAPTLSPASGTSVDNGTTTITVTSSGATCTWGTSSSSYPNASGATRTTTTGTNTLYYSCTAGSGSTISAARTGSWSYTGIAPGLVAGGNMQDATKALCTSTATGTMVSLKDTRNNVYYRVKKMADGNCWMVDNLALDLTSTYTGKPSWGTAPVTVSGSTGSVNNVPQQAVNNNTANQGQIPNNGSAKASYLYNWCAALADTSSACAASVAAVQYNTVINGVRDTSGTATTQPAVTGICPAPFRLPKGGPEATSGSKDTTANEFGKLDIAMGGTGANRASANTYTIWTGTAATNTNWLGVLSGYYLNGLGLQGIQGRWWSSTAFDATDAYYLLLSSSNTYVTPAYNNSKIFGYAVRCVL